MVLPQRNHCMTENALKRSHGLLQGVFPPRGGKRICIAGTASGHCVSLQDPGLALFCQFQSFGRESIRIEPAHFPGITVFGVQELVFLEAQYLPDFPVFLPVEIFHGGEDLQGSFGRGQGTSVRQNGPDRFQIITGGALEILGGQDLGPVVCLSWLFPY